ncbi:hypothetical protein MCNS_48150 [Mycobacterium conspicuum]|uniref:Uncharacterized protein n=1 Tax=Mycobacterium conspicuum TaxID=44010 RepID=A0A7I7YKV9_9MYCO|nr:hypothetical protein MCNS_48150 [Mycobacterium conspicuum]
MTVNPSLLRAREPAHSDRFEAFLIGGFTAGSRILDGMLRATSPHTAVAVVGDALVPELTKRPGI